MFDLARASTRASESCCLAATSTVRARAENACEPITRSAGDDPAPPLAKWEMPTTAHRLASAKSTTHCKPRRTSLALCISPLTALTTGSSISSDTPPISRTVSRNKPMSLDGSKGSASPCAFMRPRMICTRDRSAPAATRRGTSVSAGSSSLDQIKALPGVAHFSPSGHRPPVVIVAIRLSSRVVFPVPPAPAKMCNFPCANQPGQSQRMATGFMLAALTAFTFHTAGVSCFAH